MTEENEKRLWALVATARDAKCCLLAGLNEEAYRLVQDLDDELTSMIIVYENNKERGTERKQKEKTSTQPPQRIEV